MDKFKNKTCAHESEETCEEGDHDHKSDVTSLLQEDISDDMDNTSDE